MSLVPEKTNLERIATFYEHLRLCRNCDLCTKDGHTQKSYDRNLILYADQLPLPVVFIGQAPAYCEERTGEPLVGGWELLTSRCGVCANMSKCFGYFLHLDGSYKPSEVECPFAIGDAPAPLPSADVYKKRLQNVVQDMIYARDENGVRTKTVDPRTAGMQFDIILAASGFNRPSTAWFWKEKEQHNLLEENSKNRGSTTPNCAILNTVQCRNYELRDGVKQNIPPSDEQRIACGRNVVEFLQLVKPKVIVAVGNEALQTLTGLTPVLSTDGKVLGTTLPENYTAPTMASVHGMELNCSLTPMFEYAVKVVPIYHPAMHLRNKQDAEKYKSGVMKDIAVLKRVYAEYIGETNA